MKCKVKLVKTVELYIEGKSEEDIQEWLNTTTADEAEMIAKCPDVNHSEEIICTVSESSDIDCTTND